MDFLPARWMDFGADLLGHLPPLPAMPAAVWMGIALLVAVWLGERLQRAGMARTLGYWLCGVVFGIVLAWAQAWQGPGAPLGSALSLPGPMASFGKNMPSTWASLQNLSWVFDLALGWVLLELGQRIDLRWLLRNPALAATAMLEYALTWGLVALALRSWGLAWLPVSVVATLAAHSSPVMLSTLLSQWRSEGQVTERALHLGGINTLLTAITLPLVLSLVTAYTQGTAVNSVGLLGGSVLRSGLELAQPLWDAAGSVAIGFALGWLLVRLRPDTSAKPRGLYAAPAAWERAQWLSMLGAVCVAVGLAQWLGAPALLACLALGLSLRRRATGGAMGDASGAGAGLSQLAQVAMFLVAGASLPWLQWAGWQPEPSGPAFNLPVVMLAALLLVIRLCAKVLACTLTARWAGLRWAQGFALGMMLQPLSMTGLVFWAMAASALAAPHAALSHAVLLMLCTSDVLAPWLMRTVLRRMREIFAEPVPFHMSQPGNSGNSGLNTQSSMHLRRIDTHADAHGFHARG